MKKIIFLTALTLSLTTFARVLDCDVARVVPDEEGSKIIVTAESKSQVVFLKASTPGYTNVLAQIQNAKDRNLKIKLEIENNDLQFVNGVAR